MRNSEWSCLAYALTPAEIELLWQTDGDVMNSDASLYSVFAAPEDGRTPSGVRSGCC
jgi:hypothetical protein